MEKWYVKIWTEGKYIDLWSLNHTLLGATLAGFFIIISVSFLMSLVISSIIFIGWEIWEIFRNISEALGNKIFDVVTGLLGFFLMHYFVNTYFNEINIFLIVLFSYIFIEIWGCLAYKKVGAKFV